MNIREERPPRISITVYVLLSFDFVNNQYYIYLYLLQVYCKFHLKTTNDYNQRFLNYLN